MATRNSQAETNIQVYVRCRPLNASEKRQHYLSVVDVHPEKKEVVVRERMSEKSYTKTFTFDRVFSPDSTQENIYNAVAAPLIEEVLMGYNCTVFAYGQTGTGKTFTMEGDKVDEIFSWELDHHAGIIPRSMHQLFSVLYAQNLEYTMKVSFLELYNEELIDLLSQTDDTTTRLRLYEDSQKKGSVVIQGLTEVIVRTREQVYEILRKGSRKRQTAATLMNATSSRSHTVFSVTVHIKETSLDGEELLKMGKLNLVDLAGSENIARSGAVDKRAREAGNINQSLLTLGRVISALVEKTPHIPYRESKLTRLLQDSLGGRTKTSIIATISPAFCNLEETLSTLDYAHRAKRITNRPEVNQKLTKKAMIKEYTSEIERLQKDLLAAREKNGIYLNKENYDEMMQQLQNQNQENEDKANHILSLQEEVTKVKLSLEEYKRDLLSVTNRLRTTEEEYRKTCWERDALNHLVRHQIKMENVHHSEFNECLGVTELAKADVCALQNKIDTHRSVSRNNQLLTDTFINAYSDAVKDIEHGERVLQEDQMSHITSLRNDAASKIGQLRDCSSTLNTIISGLVEDTLQAFHALFQHVSSADKDVDCRLSKTKHAIERSNECYAQGFTSVKSVLSTFVAQLTSVLSEQEGILRSLLQQIESDTGKVSSRIAEFEKQQKFALLRLNTTISALMKSHEAKNEEQVRTLNSTVKTLEEAFKEALAGLAKMKSAVSDDGTGDEVRCAVTSMSDNMSAITSTLLRDVELHEEDMRCRIIDSTKQAEQKCTLLQGTLPEVREKMEALQDQAEEELKQYTSKIMDGVIEMHVLSRNSNETILNQMQEMVTKVQEKGDEHGKQTMDVCNLLDETLSSQTEQLSQLSKRLKRDDCVKKVQKCHSTFNTFVQKLTVVEQTGETPPRRKYSHPRTLTRGTPPEIVLGQFYSKVEIDNVPHLTLAEDVDSDNESCSSGGLSIEVECSQENVPPPPHFKQFLKPVKEDPPLRKRLPLGEQNCTV